MFQNESDIQRALSDIALLRRALHQSGEEVVDTRLAGITLEANMLIQVTAFSCALLLCLMEIISGNTISTTLIQGGHYADLKIIGIALMGTVLADLLVVLYFILWRAARHNGEELRSYIARNFRYVKNLSLISDLLMKLIALSLLMLAGKPEWIAPVLMAFTGDYLLQGRLFTLPTLPSVILGLACIAGAFTQFALGSGALLPPLLSFAAIAGFSIVRLTLRYRRHGNAADA